MCGGLTPSVKKLLTLFGNLLENRNEKKMLQKLHT